MIDEGLYKDDDEFDTELDLLPAEKTYTSVDNPNTDFALLEKKPGDWTV